VRRLAAAVLAVALVGACDPDTVRIVFRPDEGAHYVYRVEVESVTVIDLEGSSSRRIADKFVLQADHAVLAVGTDDSRVRVRLTGSEAVGPRTFVVRLDRAGQLAEVQRIENLPAEAFGNLGLSEIFPAAAGAPPARPLSPGERWEIDEPVDLPGQPRSRLRGAGRLSELGVVDGEEVARVESTVRLPVKGTTELGGGSFALDGSQTTTSTATHRLVDGAVQEVRAVTHGRYQLTLLPPPGQAGPAVPGMLTLEVRSRTRRVG
jgi:hypothetical protein